MECSTIDSAGLKVNGMLHNRFGGNTIPGDNNPHDCWRMIYYQLLLTILTWLPLATDAAELQTFIDNCKMILPRMTQYLPLLDLWKVRILRNSNFLQVCVVENLLASVATLSHNNLEDRKRVRNFARNSLLLREVGSFTLGSLMSRRFYRSPMERQLFCPSALLNSRFDWLFARCHRHWIIEAASGTTSTTIMFLMYVFRIRATSSSTLSLSIMS